MNEHTDRFVGDAADFEVDDGRFADDADDFRIDCANPIRDKHGRFAGCRGGGSGGGKGGGGGATGAGAAWAAEAFGESRAQRSPAEVAAAKEYQASGFTDVNNSLRGLPARRHDPYDYTSPPPTDVDRLVEHLDGQMSPTHAPATVYRGVRYHDMSGVKVGDVFEDPAYLSTSYEPEVAERFARKSPDSTLMEITLPAGTWAAHLSDTAIAESEILLERGTPLRITEITTNALGQRVIRASAENHLRASDDD